MPDKEKCELLKKKANKTFYYKCKSVTCDKECLIYVLWEYIEKVGLDGKKVVVGFSVKEVGCECLKFDKWDGRDGGPYSCKLEMARVESVEKGGRKYEKSIVHCVNDGCTKDCVYYIKYKDPDKELGEIINTGCECVEWDKL
jgi:hypothetical protein